MTKIAATLTMILALAAPMAQAQGFIWDTTMSFPKPATSVTKSTKGEAAPVLLPTGE